MAKYLTTEEVAELLRAPVESVRYWGASEFSVGPVWS